MIRKRPEKDTENPPGQVKYFGTLQQEIQEYERAQQQVWEAEQQRYWQEQKKLLDNDP